MIHSIMTYIYCEMNVTISLVNMKYFVFGTRFITMCKTYLQPGFTETRTFFSIIISVNINSNSLIPSNILMEFLFFQLSYKCVFCFVYSLFEPRSKEAPSITPRWIDKTLIIFCSVAPPPHTHFLGVLVESSGLLVL